jgi:hypothetical protein
MPKRSNEFQHLILLIEKALRPQGANVTESKELLDHILSEEREVDIVIELVDGIHPVTIGVECKGGGKKPRRATVEWVEQMWGKHLTLPTDKLILVAKAGFTPSAEKKAAFWNIETLIEFERNLKPGVYLVDDTGKKRSVVAIKVEAKCIKEVTTVEMSQGSYGEAAISYGKARFFGKPMQFLAVQQPDDDPRCIVSMKQPKSNKYNES